MLSAFAGGRLLGVRHGAGRPWALALHGWRRTHADWSRALSGLDAIAVDLPGFGASPEPPGSWGAADYADVVLPVLADELDGPAVVLGHSFGGRVAVHLAARAPELVAALVLTAAPLVRPPGSTPRKPALAFRLGRALHRRGLLGEQRMEALRRRYGSADYRAATGVMRHVHVRVVNETYEAQLRAVTCPVELVWGADDPDVPVAVAEAAAELLGDARLTLVPGAGHLTPLTAPEALRAAAEKHRP